MIRFRVLREAAVLDELGVLTQPGEFAPLAQHRAAAVYAEMTARHRTATSVVVCAPGSADVDDGVLIAAARVALTTCLAQVLAEDL